MTVETQAEASYTSYLPKLDLQIDMHIYGAYNENPTAVCLD